ncbi:MULTISPECIES: hypothetical protein [unclassified Rathayibacter]|jgi:ureidoacrylate peracid hydrolase|uniref:hypothetical protein n=1 Tax=unclassified Rathayibacter TaxID=2609250 RepID=UPI0015E40219|nr:MULTISPECIES: hypothetical protein [unclassified Rathayibacter]
MDVASGCVLGAPGQHEASPTILGAAFATVLPWRDAMAALLEEAVPAASSAV